MLTSFESKSFDVGRSFEAASFEASPSAVDLAELSIQLVPDVKNADPIPLTIRSPLYSAATEAQETGQASGRKVSPSERRKLRLINFEQANALFDAIERALDGDGEAAQPPPADNPLHESGSNTNNGGNGTNRSFQKDVLVRRVEMYHEGLKRFVPIEGLQKTAIKPNIKLRLVIEDPLLAEASKSSAGPLSPQTTAPTEPLNSNNNNKGGGDDDGAAAAQELQQQRLARAHLELAASLRSFAIFLITKSVDIETDVDRRGELLPDPMSCVDLIEVLKQRYTWAIPSVREVTRALDVVHSMQQGPSSIGQKRSAAQSLRGGGNDGGGTGDTAANNKNNKSATTTTSGRRPSESQRKLQHNVEFQLPQVTEVMNDLQHENERLRKQLQAAQQRINDMVDVQSRLMMPSFMVPERSQAMTPTRGEEEDESSALTPPQQSSGAPAVVHTAHQATQTDTLHYGESAGGFDSHPPIFNPFSATMPLGSRPPEDSTTVKPASEDSPRAPNQNDDRTRSPCDEDSVSGTAGSPLQQQQQQQQQPYCGIMASPPPATPAKYLGHRLRGGVATPLPHRTVSEVRINCLFADPEHGTRQNKLVSLAQPPTVAALENCCRHAFGRQDISVGYTDIDGATPVVFTGNAALQAFLDRHDSSLAARGGPPPIPVVIVFSRVALDRAKGLAAESAAGRKARPPQPTGATGAGLTPTPAPVEPNSLCDADVSRDAERTFFCRDGIDIRRPGSAASATSRPCPPYSRPSHPSDVDATASHVGRELVWPGARAGTWMSRPTGLPATDNASLRLIFDAMSDDGGVSAPRGRIRGHLESRFDTMDDAQRFDRLLGGPAELDAGAPNCTFDWFCIVMLRLAAE